MERSGLPTINEGERFEFDLEVDRRGKHSAVNLTPAAD
jgi:CspA family cold shock protein